VSGVRPPASGARPRGMFDPAVAAAAEPQVGWKCAAAPAQDAAVPLRTVSLRSCRCLS